MSKIEFTFLQVTSLQVEVLYKLSAGWKPQAAAVLSGQKIRVFDVSIYVYRELCTYSMVLCIQHGTVPVDMHVQ
jgi:hypothetical protein